MPTPRAAHGSLTLSALWLLWAALVVALTVATVLALRHTRQEVDLASKADLTQVAARTRTQIEAYLEARHNDARVLAGRAEVWGLLAAQADNAARLRAMEVALLQTIQIYGYHAIRLVDARLQVRSSTLTRALEEQESAAIQSALQTRQAQLVDLHVRGDCQPCLGFVQPVFQDNNRNAQVLGAVYLEIGAQRDLYRFLPTWPGQDPANEALLLRREGNTLVYLSPVRQQTGAAALEVQRSINTPDLLETQASTATAARTLEGKDYASVAVVAAVTPIAGTPWALVVKASLASLQAPMQVLHARFLVGTGVFVVLMGFAAALLWRVRHAEARSRALARDAAFASAKHIAVDGYVLLDDNGRILEANPALGGMLGYSVEALAGRPLAELELPQAPQRLQDSLAHLRHAKAAVIETRWRHSDGHGVDLRASMAYLQEGGKGYFQGSLRDIGPELRRLEHEQRLRHLYEFQSAVSSAVHQARTRGEIFETVCVAAVRSGGFLLAWVGIEDRQQGLLVPVAVHGNAAEYVNQIHITTDPALPTSHGPTRQSMLHRVIQTVDDFATDARVAPWRAKAMAQGFVSSAAVPIVVSDTVVAVANFYSGLPHFFDAEVQALLSETASNISLALQALEFKVQKHAAESARQDSDERFARVFDASPIPMLIMSFGTRRLIAMNQALERVFGYTAADIPNEAAWFDLAYPDPQLRQAAQRDWNEALPRARMLGPHAVRTSPEVSLRCKDGSDKVVRSSMSVVSDEIILQWQDLTETLQAQTRLRQDEERFRSMIEQTLLGIYVTQNDRIVYANPRFCEIVGWSHEELMGQDSLRFIGRDEHDRQNVLLARAQAKDAGVGDLLYFPFRHKDGHHIDIGLQPTLGRWDGKAALVVMAQDLTERKRAEERIATYVKQLEAAMQGTLQAVAKMVDLRDPYTSGHEKRVGLIAADIAKAMGWTPQQCQNLQMIGLVHDIGKIAIPAELLSKPTRLTPLEYELMKTHVEKGYEILKDVEFPIPIADIIRQHHERMDGSGYPLGLHGAQISMEARILAVADVLESMASHRPYRPALGLDRAMQELEAHCGQWFDADVVATVRNMVNQQGYLLPS